MRNDIPDWVTYPEEDWVPISPEQAGLDPAAFRRFIDGLDPKGSDFGGEDHTGNKWGAVLTRGGYLVHEWGDRHYRFQTASVGKGFVRAIFGLAVEEGMVKPDDLIKDTWTGEGLLSHPHKHLNEGHHNKLTWNHLLGPKEEGKQYGGFPIEIGTVWRRGDEDKSVLNREFPEWKKWRVLRWVFPEWAKWTGDPFYDNYSHTEPGTAAHYSSGGFWRLGQALTALWDRDLKEILDQRIFSKIGITPDRWEWYTGKEVQAQEFYYPKLPGSFTYLDPPYEINGHVVRGSPGWIVISASDLARYGHLVATNGIWKGERVVGAEWIRGHAGGNGCGMSGESKHMTALGVVTTQGLDYQHMIPTVSLLPEEVFAGPVKV